MVSKLSSCDNLYLVNIKPNALNASGQILQLTTWADSMSLHLQQGDQSGRYIVLWATFQSLWQQLFCPNLPHFRQFFVKLSKSFIFLAKSFGNSLLFGHADLLPLKSSKANHTTTTSVKGTTVEKCWYQYFQSPFLDNILVTVFQKFVRATERYDWQSFF